MKTVELLREDEWSEDRRKVVAGVTTWPDEGIPVLAWLCDTDTVSRAIGRITNIRREGNRILGDTVLDYDAYSVGGNGEPQGMGVIDPMGYAHSDGVTFGSYALKYALPCTEDQYIWKD